MQFNECIGDETCDKEYKIGVIYWNKEISYDEAIEYLKNGKWDFNDCITSTIIAYLNKYLSKYIAAFTHNLSSIKKGYLYIGVDDDGIVKGIPWKGEMNINFTKHIINEIFKHDLKFPSERVKSYLRNQIKIETINVNFDKNKHKINNDYLKASLKNFYNRVNIYKKYESFKKMWIRIMNSQGGKISDNLNNNRLEFIKYLDERGIMRKKDFTHTYSSLEYLCDIPTYYDMRAKLRIGEFDELRRGNVIKYKDITSSTKTDLHINLYAEVFCLYLYGRYHDLKRDVYRNFKPIHPKFKIDRNYPKFLLSQCNIMIPSWVNNNKNVNLYVIKITIPSSFLNDGECIMYYNERKRKYEQCFRTFDSTGPVTLSLY